MPAAPPCGPSSPFVLHQYARLPTVPGARHIVKAAALLLPPLFFRPALMDDEAVLQLATNLPPSLVEQPAVKRALCRCAGVGRLCGRWAGSTGSTGFWGRSGSSGGACKRPGSARLGLLDGTALRGPQPPTRRLPALLRPAGCPTPCPRRHCWPSSSMERPGSSSSSSSRRAQRSRALRERHYCISGRHTRSAHLAGSAAAAAAAAAAHLRRSSLGSRACC